jgi:hypothetical protein
MTAFRFPAPEAVRAVLGLVSPEVAARGGTLLVEADGAVVVVANLPTELRKALREAGAAEIRTPGAKALSAGRTFLHWAELVPLTPDPDPDLRQVLFSLPPGSGWLKLAAELVRLGCDSLEIAKIGESEGSEGQWLIRATRPPYYTVMGTGDWKVYTRQGPVWVAFGWRHPYAERVQLGNKADSTILRLDRDGWHTDTVGKWTELTERLSLDMEPAETVTAKPPTERLTVRLRLVPSPRGSAPTAWSVSSPVDSQLTTLVHQLPEAVTVRLQVAHYRTAGGEEGALLRVRPGAEVTVLEGLLGYTPHPQLPSIWVPVGRTIDPPLRPHTLLTLLDPPAGHITWLEPLEGDSRGAFRSRRIPEDSFRPLSERVLYAADRDKDAVSAWIGTTVFDWEPLDLPVARDPEPDNRNRQSRTNRNERERPAPEPAPEPRRVAPVPEARAQVRLERTETSWVPPDVGSQERELQRLQDEFRRDPGRDDLWIPMAALHHALNQPREAASCWAHALWEASAEERTALATRWASQVPAPSELTPEASAELSCAVVAHLLAGNNPAPVPELQRWLDTNDGLLDVRLRWLARRHVAQLAGGDVLALARARDTVLASIRGGLGTSRDVPAFLRTSTTPEDRRVLAASLAALPERLGPHIPKSAPVECTRSYLRLTIAWAQASLGLDEPVRQAMDFATRTLPAQDPVHQVLLGLYRSGIEEALAGLPAETPPPPAVRDALAALDRFDRYKVDRLRNQSVAVLAETGTRTAFASFVRDEVDTLPAIPTDQLLPTITRWLLELSREEPVPGLLRVLNAVVAVSEAEASRVLNDVIGRSSGLGPADRVEVLVEALSVAAALRRPDSAEAALEPLASGLTELARHDPSKIVAPASTAARSLARCGLAEPARRVLLALHEAVPKENWTLRLQLRAALAQVGGEVADAIRTAFEVLGRQLSPKQRLEVVGATAELATPLPAAEAVAVWSQLAPHAAIEDAYSTSSHFALSFLYVAERLAAAHVHPDRLLGPEGRRWIDADEHRVRQHIHAESDLT